MFIGEYKHKVDSKGRLAVPAKFRKKLKNKAVVTRGLDNSLFLYPIAEWEKLAEKLMNLPLSQAKSRAFSRLMLAGASRVELDSQGRINLPDYLLKYAKIKKNATFAGLYNRIEIWDNNIWQKYKARAEKDSDKIAESLSELGV